MQWHRLLVPALLAGMGFAVSTLVAYFLSRTRGVLGFEETATTTGAVIGMVAEIVAFAALGFVLASRLRDRRGERGQAASETAAASSAVA